MTFNQSAFGELPYTVDWSDWLGGDTIESHAVVPTAPLVIPQSSHTSSSVTFWVNSEECNVGDLLPVRVAIVTADGLRESVTCRFAITE